MIFEMASKWRRYHPSSKPLIGDLIVNVVAEAFGWLRWAGTAYLVYLGVKQW